MPGHVQYTPGGSSCKQETRSSGERRASEKGLGLPGHDHCAREIATVRINGLPSMIGAKRILTR